VNKRIYLTGLVTGRNYKSVYVEFAAAKSFLLNQGFDEVINPCELVSADTGWTEAMLILLPYLATCNFMALLPGYAGSNGAMTEYYFGRGMENEGRVHAIIHLSVQTNGTFTLQIENTVTLK
jgi:hypothetical protein